MPVSSLDRALYQKKTEFWIRCAHAARYLFPGDGAGWLDRAMYRWLSRLAHGIFMKFAAQEVAAWRIRMAQDECKHDKAGVDSEFCPSCGKQLGADAESAAVVERIVRKVLNEYDVKPKAPASGKKVEKQTQTLADKLGLKKQEEKK